MLRLQSDFLEVLLAACDGKLADVQLQWSPDTALTVVMAAKGYPGSYQKGTVISNLDRVTTAKVGCNCSSPCFWCLTKAEGRMLYCMDCTIVSRVLGTLSNARSQQAFRNNNATTSRVKQGMQW